MNSRTIALVVFSALLLFGTFNVRAQSRDALSKVLIPGEDWQVVADNLGFVDGASSDAEGNFYFCDMRGKPPAVYKVAPDGKTRTKIAELSVSGTKIGPDGRLYACGGGKLVAIDLSNGQVTTIAQGLKTNDIAINHRGQIFMTETGRKQVTLIDAKTGAAKPADIGITAPNGIGFSPDQNTLIVSDYGGLNVYTFTVAPDGTLSNKTPHMTMKAPEKKPFIANGDGLAVDTDGRAYVTTALGLQIFDADGKLLGILDKPQPGAMVNAAFAGPNLEYLYLTCGNKVFRRKTRVKGALGYMAPVTRPHR
ncbi:MAG TPA: SMP-30/gluconolactonase/LRE family protein [Tepidisphaeraceae bacterium]|jgi:enterochelin esterase family protein